MRPPEFWNHRDGKKAAYLTRLILSPLGALYSAIGAAKFQTARKPRRPKARVICVGNLTLGGVGKTPIVLAIISRLQARGLKVAALTRGYGGELKGPVFVGQEHNAKAVGDEAMLLARIAPTIVSRDRRAAAKFSDAFEIDVIVMDDGFQNFGITKDLSILIVDGEIGFGNRYVFPAGPLREPINRGLARADAIVTMRSGPAASRSPVSGLAAWRGTALNAWLTPAPEAISTLRGKRLVLFAGIGRPQKVVDTLTGLGAEVVNVAPYPDHHPYTQQDIDNLKSLAAQHGATLVTTEKDFVRLTTDQRDGILTIPVTVQFAVEQAMDALLAPVIKFVEQSDVSNWRWRR